MIHFRLLGHRAVEYPHNIHVLTCRWCNAILYRMVGYWFETAHVREWPAVTKDERP